MSWADVSILLMVVLFFIPFFKNVNRCMSRSCPCGGNIKWNSHQEIPGSGLMGGGWCRVCDTSYGSNVNRCSYDDILKVYVCSQFYENAGWVYMQEDDQIKGNIQIHDKIKREYWRMYYMSQFKMRRRQ